MRPLRPKNQDTYVSLLASYFHKGSKQSCINYTQFFLFKAVGAIQFNIVGAIQFKAVGAIRLRAHFVFGRSFSVSLVSYLYSFHVRSFVSFLLDKQPFIAYVTCQSS